MDTVFVLMNWNYDDSYVVAIYKPKEVAEEAEKNMWMVDKKRSQQGSWPKYGSLEVIPFEVQSIAE